MKKYDKMIIKINCKNGTRITLEKNIVGEEEYFNPEIEIQKIQEEIKKPWLDFNKLHKGKVIGSSGIKTREILYYEIDFESNKEKEDLIKLNKEFEKEYKKARHNLMNKIFLSDMFKIK